MFVSNHRLCCLASRREAGAIRAGESDASRQDQNHSEGTRHHRQLECLVEKRVSACLLRSIPMSAREERQNI